MNVEKNHDGLHSGHVNYNGLSPEEIPQSVSREAPGIHDSRPARRPDEAENAMGPLVVAEYPVPGTQGFDWVKGLLDTPPL